LKIAKMPTRTALTASTPRRRKIDFGYFRRRQFSVAVVRVLADARQHNAERSTSAFFAPNGYLCLHPDLFT